MKILRKIAEWRRYQGLWRRHFRNTIFIPSEHFRVLDVLEKGGSPALIEELQRLASLGSGWAAAALGYIRLNVFCENRRDVEGAISACRDSAASGDPYAQYVMAWAMIFSGRHHQALQFMKSAGKQRFPPAVLDLTRFIWNGWGVQSSDPKVAISMIRYARRARHEAALPLLSVYLRSVRTGNWKKLLGYLLTPIAAIWIIFALYRHPFSDRVLLFDPGRRDGILR